MKHISQINPTAGMPKHVRDRIASEVAKLDLEATNVVEMRAGAKAANIRVSEDRNSTKWLNNPRSSRAVILTRGDEVREFSSAALAAKVLGLNLNSVYTCLCHGRSIGGWRIQYAEDKAGAA